MPIDSGVYDRLGQQPQGINQPFANLQQVMNLRQQQQVNQALEQERQSRAAETQQQTLKLQQQQSDQQAVDAAVAAGGSNDDILGRLAQTRHGHLIPQMQEQFAKAADLDQKAKDAKLATEKAGRTTTPPISRRVLLSYKDYGQPAMLNAFQAAAQVAQAHGHDVSQVVQAVQQRSDLAGTAHEGRHGAMAQGPEPVKQTVVPKGGTLVQTGGSSPATGTVVAQGAPDQTAADLDAQYQGLLKKKALGQPLTADEQASKDSYEQRKLLGPEAAQAFAANEQARAQAAATAQQARTQAFTEAQAGRSELTNKVEQPYLDAKEKASTLRSVIDAAQNGNMVAGNVQTLLGTLGLVTMEGVKRINTTELQQVGGAGSLLERIKGEVGGVTAGKPLSPKIQGDLKQLSDMLEQSATQKYQQGWQSVTNRYGLKDEQSLVPAGGSTTTPAAAGGAITVRDPQGGVHTFPDQASADKFKKAAGIQ